MYSPLVLTPLALARLCHPTYVWGRVHHIIQSALLRLMTGHLRFPDGRICRRLLLQMPPQHWKSTLVSQLFPPCVFGQTPHAKLILLSYTAELAQTHAEIARDHVREFGTVLNPALKLHPRHQARGMWKTTAGGYMVATSALGTVTGRAATGIIFDDPLCGIEDSSSPTQRDKLWATYSSVAETRLAPDGWVVVLGTPWHSDDLAGRLLSTEPEKWHHLRFPALAEQEGPDPLGRAPGECLLPHRYPPEWYADVKRKLELRGHGHLWQALYQCDPQGDPSLRAFNDPAYFADHIWADALPITERNKPVHRVLALDPAHARPGKVGDYSAFADITLMSDRHVYADVTLIREPLPALYARAVAIVRQAQAEGRPFRAMLIEVNGAQIAIAHAIAEKLDQAGITLHIDQHTTGSKEEKAARIVTGLGPLLAQKRFHFLGQSVGNKLTVKQMQELPNGAHDDGADACELGVQLLNLLLTGQKKAPTTVLRA